MSKMSIGVNGNITHIEYYKRKFNIVNLTQWEMIIELALSTDLLSFEHPSVLLFCLLISLISCL